MNQRWYKNTTHVTDIRLGNTLQCECLLQGGVSQDFIGHLILEFGAFFLLLLGVERLIVGQFGFQHQDSLAVVIPLHSSALRILFPVVFSVGICFR